MGREEILSMMKDNMREIFWMEYCCETKEICCDEAEKIGQRKEKFGCQFLL